MSRRMNGTAEEQMKVILKGVHQAVSTEELEKKVKRSIEEDRPLVVKLGLDPSAPDIHLGHTVVLRKMKQMQDFGHEIVIIIGDFTGRIGDPTGKTSGRKALSQEQVMENAWTYQQQIFKVLDQEKTRVHYNSEWLKELNFEDVLRLAASTTVARMMERDDFQNRFKNNTPIGIHEFFYPLMQAYDSIALDADVELGGTDQTFNILMGRTLQKHLGKEQQVAMFMPILEGLDGIEKMSKSLGNYIGITEEAKVMFKKVMEIPDELIIRYYELVTDEHPDRIADIRKQLEEGRNPRDVKYELAQIITQLYHPRDKMEEAKQFYDEAFSRKSIPRDIPEFVIEGEGDLIADVIGQLVQAGYASSNGEFRRLLKQGGIQVNQEKVEDLQQVLICGDVMRIGKKNFIRIVK